MKTLFKPFLILALLLAFVLPAMSAPHIITISGTSAKVAISATPIRARWFSVIAEHGNTATSRFGDSTTSSTVGVPLRADASHFEPYELYDYYTLSNWYVYVATGDTLTILYDGD